VPLATHLAAVRLGSVVADRSGVAVISARGPDTRRFANGMFTQNIRDLAVGSATRTAWCDDRGRMLGLADLYAVADDALLFVLEGVPASAFFERFEKFVVFDDVTLTDETDKTALITVQGATAADIVRKAGHPTPDGWVGSGPFGVGRRDRTGYGGYDLVVPRADADATLAALITAGAVPGRAEVLEVLRIEAGRPAWPADMDDKTFPHEVGLRDEVLDFRKGCYVGQEIINRMDTFAKVPRALIGLTIEGDAPTGAVLLADDKPVGRLGSVIRSPERGVIGLGLVKRPHEAPGGLLRVVDGERSWTARVQTLPFGPANA